MSYDDEEWEDDDDWYIGKCDHCERDQVRVMNQTDPFLAEVYPEEENHCSSWCAPCWTERYESI